jgi:AraC family transcriptional regulator
MELLSLYEKHVAVFVESEPMQMTMLPGGRSAQPVALPDQPFIKMIRRGQLLAVHVKQLDDPTPFSVPSFGIGPAFMATTYLRDMRVEVWRNGRSLGRLAGADGTLQLFDLRHTWRAVIHPPYESMNLLLPIDLLAEAAGTSIDDLEFDPPAYLPDRVDPTMRALAEALVPAFDRPGELSALFVDRVLLAAAAHVVHLHSRPAPEQVLPRPTQGLAPWQQRRASQMLLEQLDRDTALAELAAACGLSLGHFSRAFRQSFGLPPHRWLLRERVRHAAYLLTTTTQPIDEIAGNCGFVDQSHLSRVFRKMMHMPPAAWRRARIADDLVPRA